MTVTKHRWIYVYAILPYNSLFTPTYALYNIWHKVLSGVKPVFIQWLLSHRAITVARLKGVLDLTMYPQLAGPMHFLRELMRNELQTASQRIENLLYDSISNDGNSSATRLPPTQALTHSHMSVRARTHTHTHTHTYIYIYIYIARLVYFFY